MKIQGGPIHALLTYLRSALRQDRALLQIASPDEICTGTYGAAPIRETDKGTVEVYSQELPCLCFSALTAGAKAYGGFTGLEIKGKLWWVARARAHGELQSDGRASTSEALGLNWTLSVLERVHRHINAGKLTPTGSAEATWDLDDGGIDLLRYDGPAEIMAEGKDLMGFSLPITVTLAKPPYMVQDPPAVNILTATLTPYNDEDPGTVIGPDVVMVEVTDGP